MINDQSLSKESLTEQKLIRTIDGLSKFIFDKYIIISLKGEKLSKEYFDLAKSIGVKHPEKIRILSLDCAEFNNEYNIFKLFDLNWLANKSEYAPWLVCSYGVVINKDSHSRSDWNRIFRFVSYYECYRSIKGFVNIYLRSVKQFGWENNPFERDTNLTAKIKG